MESYYMGSRLPMWRKGDSQNVTFVVTQECNLRCKYCYITGKNDGNIMTFDVAQKSIDYLLAEADLFAKDAVVLDFIGGEPLMEIDLIDKIVDYFKLTAYQKGHRWFSHFAFSARPVLLVAAGVWPLVQINARVDAQSPVAY